MITKICACCKKEKELDQFYKRTVAKDGLQHECIECTKIKMKVRYPKMREQHKEYRSLNRNKFMYWRAKQRAKEYDLDFNIEISDIIIPTHCPLLGIKLAYTQGTGRQDNAMSLDRVDPTKGYIKGNIQVISDLANRMKNSATKEQLITFSKAILNIYG